jgi:hypothetical protein
VVWTVQSHRPEDSGNTTNTSLTLVFEEGMTSDSVVNNAF